jgi:hypothetical protein
MGKRVLEVLGVGALAYIIYMYYKKKNQPIIAPQNAAQRTQGEITKATLKRQGAALIEANQPEGYSSVKAVYSNPNSPAFSERQRQMSETLFTGQKQYVTLENLIPNRYGMYNNFDGKYNRLNVEDTTNIDTAERTQAFYKRPKPIFNNAL